MKRGRTVSQPDDSQKAVSLKIPVAEPPTGETNIRNFKPQPRLTEKAADGLERLYWGVRGKEMPNGDFVDSRAKAILWLLERIETEAGHALAANA